MLSMVVALHICNTSQLNPRLLQPQSSSFKTFKFTAYCSVQAYATKSKRKPKPSFFEQIQHKWSLKLTSSRKKFPWQQQQQQQQQLVQRELQDQEEKEEEEEEEEEEVGEDIEDVDPRPLVSDTTVSFSRSTKLITAPWVHGNRSRKAHFYVEPKSGDDFVHGFWENGDGVFYKEERVKKKVNWANKRKEEVVNFDDGSVVELAEDKEINNFEIKNFNCSAVHGFLNNEEDNVSSSVVDTEERTEKAVNNDFNKAKEEVVIFDKFSVVELAEDKEIKKFKDGAVHGYNEDNVSSGGVNIEESRGKEVDSDFNKLDEKVVDRDDNGIAMVKDLSDVVSVTEKPFVGNREFKNFEVSNYDDSNSIESLSWEDLNEVISVTKMPFEGSRETRDIEVSNTGGSNLSALPWDGGSEMDSVEEEKRRKKSNTDLAERLLPEHELKRLRNVALRMLERFKVGAVGITQDLVDAIHEKWKLDEVVKVKFEWPLSCNMKRAHEILESRTGGLVIWRSGKSLVLYRGTTYKFQCVQSYNKQNGINVTKHAGEAMSDDKGVGMKDLVGTVGSIIPDAANYLNDLSQEELMEFNELNHLLDELGPRYKDWCGREPLPVDADLLPPVVPGYKPPFRLLPYGVKPGLTNKKMTIFRKLARTTPPHFVLGRNKELQGLAKAMTKLWEKSAIAKIAIKRGVHYTRNEIMAEQLKRLTGGTLLSRNKEYIVFYRGNDFLPPVVNETLKERRKLTYLHQDEEDQVRHMASPIVGSTKTTRGPLVAGTLAETVAATTRWGHQPSGEDVEKMMRNSVLAKHASLLKHLEDKRAQAIGKLKQADKALEKVQKNLEPAELPKDLEIITEEERFLFRKIGLSMKPYLFLGRRGVFDGTIENMHLHWKYRELVKIIVKRKSIAQVKHIAISLEAESGGVLVSVDRTTKGYAIIIYRGKNYMSPQSMRPVNLLTRRQALARSIELQRREALKHHISDLEERRELVKSELEELKADKKFNVDKTL